jgi:hypothetical protein
MQNAYEPSKLAWRVIWRTLVFYLVAFAVLVIVGQLNLAIVKLRADVLGFIVIILEYWPVLLLVYYNTTQLPRLGRLVRRHDTCRVVPNRMAQRLALRRIFVFLYWRPPLAAAHRRDHWCTSW